MVMMLQRFTDRAAFVAMPTAGSDFVDWTGAFSIAPPPPYSWTTDAGRSFTIALPASLDRPTQTSPGGAWDGNFTNGDQLLLTVAQGQYAVRLEFASPIRGIGCQTEPPIGSATNRYEQTLRVFSANGDSMMVTRRVTQNTRPNGPAGNPLFGTGLAPFFGGLSDKAKIRAVEFNVHIVQGPVLRPSDFAMNRLDILL